MNIRIQNRNLELLPAYSKLIERHGRKIRKLLPTFSSEVLDLDVALEKLPRGSQYQTSLLLTIPQRAIKVEEIEDNPTTSIVRAFAELKRRVKRFKSQLNREKLRRRQPLPEPVAQAVPALEIENEANEYLDKIENFIRRGLHHRVVAGQMPPGIINPQAVVDDVFLKITATAATKPTDLSIEQWVFKLAREILENRLQELDDHRDESHMSDRAQADKAWEDEDLNFYQPDESLQIGDILEDGNASTPEELLAREETEERLHTAVAKLPDEIRESFVLFALEGFTSDEVAMMIGESSEQVLENVETARQHLQKAMSS